MRTHTSLEFELVLPKTPDLSKDIRCHERPYSFYAFKPPDHARDYVQIGLSACVIADDHLLFLRGLCGYIWVSIIT